MNDSPTHISEYTNFYMVESISPLIEQIEEFHDHAINNFDFNFFFLDCNFLFYLKRKIIKFKVFFKGNYRNYLNVNPYCDFDSSCFPFTSSLIYNRGAN